MPGIPAAASATATGRCDAKCWSVACCLSALRTSLLTEEAVDRFKVKFRRLLQQPPTGTNARRRKKLEAAIGNVSDAIAKGLYSPTLVKRLQDAEAELAALPPPLSPVVKVDDLLKRLPEAVARYRVYTARS